MVSRLHLPLIAEDRSYFAILKKQVRSLTIEAGFAVGKVNEIDLIIAELVTNLVKHAGGGSVYVKLIEEDRIQGIEIISIDNGPGISDVVKMTGDGVSTKNTLGHGLGSIKRLSSFYQIYSVRNWGTIQLVRVFNSPPKVKEKKNIVSTNMIVIPKTGETASGDGFFMQQQTNCISFFLGDGLGHGPDAEKAVLAAGESFMKCKLNDPTEILRIINEDVKKTRGLVATVVVFDIEHRLWKICGIGNISTRLNTPTTTKSYLAYNGIVGMKLPNTLKHQEIPYDPLHSLIMCSDGIKSRWDLLKFPNIGKYDPTMLCAAVIKDFNRNTDDVSIAHCQINL